MSKQFDAHEHLKHIPAGTQFDDTEPRSGRIFIAAFVSVVSIIVSIAGVYSYYSWYRSKVLFERQLSPSSVELSTIRSHEDSTLTSYGYVDKEKGVVRLPISRAMDIVVAEAAEGKERYPVAAKLLPKPEDLVTAGAPNSVPTTAATQVAPALAIPQGKEKH